MPKKTYNTPTTTTIEPAVLVANILQSEMGLTSKQIALAYQNYEIPPDGPFVAVGYLNPSQQISNMGYFDSTTATEVQETVFLHTIQIEIMSLAPDNSARIRKEEIALALKSFYSQQQQDKNVMGIAWLQGDFIDGSYAEETAMLQRYITTCAVTALHRKVKTADYFSTFPIELITSDQAGRETDVNINPTEAPFGG